MATSKLPCSVLRPRRRCRRRHRLFRPLTTFLCDRQTDDTVLPPVCGCQTDDEREERCCEEMRSWATFDTAAVGKRRRRQRKSLSSRFEHAWITFSNDLRRVNGRLESPRTCRSLKKANKQKTSGSCLFSEVNRNIKTMEQKEIKSD